MNKFAFALLLSLAAAVALAQSPIGATVTKDAKTPDGTPVQLDLPVRLHLKNTGGSDGAGLCVFTSITHSATWQSVTALDHFRDWMTRYPGGGWPEKVDAMIAKITKEKSAPAVKYLQVEDDDLEILKLACRTGRMPGVTYSFSPSGRYGGQRIAHMVTLLHASDSWFCVLDNNFPGTYEWMTPAEFRRSYLGGGRSGWSVILLNPGPPPLPKV